MLARPPEPVTTALNADIVDLRDFYASPLGVLVSRAVCAALSPVWPFVPEERLLGIGFPLPYFERFGPDAERALAFMPAQQGALRWPARGASRTALVGLDCLPVGDACIDRVLLVHALEFAEHPQELLAEIWRVLAPGGRLVVVAPNRRGLWARFDHTPFGSGRPYSRGQLARLLKEAAFAPSAWTDALFFPPFRRGGLLRLAPTVERTGRRLWPAFSGLVVMEALKLVSRGLPVPVAKRERLRIVKPVLVPQGASALNRGAS
jgi:SAM-dependent methyltransferase